MLKDDETRTPGAVIGRKPLQTATNDVWPQVGTEKKPGGHALTVNLINEMPYLTQYETVIV